MLALPVLWAWVVQGLLTLLFYYPRVVRFLLYHVQQPDNQVPAFPPRLSRTAAREALYHSLASGGLS